MKSIPVHVGAPRVFLESLEPRRLLVVGSVDPSNLLTEPGEFSGVGVMRYMEEDTPKCTGTLLPTGQHVLTAAHCVFFMTGQETWYMAFEVDDEFVLYPFTLSDAAVNPSFDGNANKGYDIAIIDLGDGVPVDRYDIYRNTDELFQDVEIVGYGIHGDADSCSHTAYGLDGLKRHGKNSFEAFADELNDPLELCPGSA